VLPIEAPWQATTPVYGDILGTTPKMQRIFKLVAKVAPTESTVLILGESGTGKELIARAIHLQSRRQNGAFVPVNCAALPETILEAELFGYERGAFTGAVHRHDGRFVQADKGTLFLDEIGEIPTHIQVKLLRVLQEGEVERLGGRTQKVDLRLVAATNQDLRAAVKEGRFREDLFYRLAEIVVEIPPLRDRPGDAALLAHGFVRKFANEQRRGAMTLQQDAIDAIDAHPWPGNVRELENVIKRAVIMADGNGIGADDIGLSPGDADLPALNLRQVREHAEKIAVLRVLGRVNGNLSKAAEVLGVSRPTLYDLMHRFGLK
jgi:two-component system, NtrC family, response regulator